MKSIHTKSSYPARIRRKGIIAPVLFAILFASACSDWLDGALPKDKNLEERQFSTVAGIHTVLNGLYTHLIYGGTLYGGALTMSEIELLAHYYFFETQISSDMFSGFAHFYNVSNYEWDARSVSGSFRGTWNSAYKVISEINTFINRLSASQVLSDERKNVMLGEAYGLRAFLHFDMFRLFAHEGQDIPYNQSPDAVPHEPLPEHEFYKLLMADVDTAVYLLKNDPILTFGIRDLRHSEAASSSSEHIFENYLRNHRMNYYAVQALKARILTYRGDLQKAAELATEILDKSFDNLFRFANKNTVTDRDNRNHIFYEEVMFGISNPDLYSRWRNYTVRASYGRTHGLIIANLQDNIFRNDFTTNDISLWEDVRARQWSPSTSNDGLGLYISLKYQEFPFTANNPRRLFQPLIRTAELHYIIAEAWIEEGEIEKAIVLLNDFRFQRGVQYGSLPDPALVSREEAYDILETEYYKEFYGEGQAYFYLKRQKSSRVFNMNGSGKIALPERAFQIPLPDSEVNF